MMTKEQYFLGKLAEEAAELAQIAIKAQQFGLLHTFGGQGDHPQRNVQRITAELNDVIGVVKLLQLECDADIVLDSTMQIEKMNKVDHWMQRARHMGFVE